MSSNSATHWSLDEYRQLQLPHPDHPEDGHTDVVYGIHLEGDYLVSVSADQTARIWDLITQRPLRSPLIGHTGSVTVVQFDADANCDVIVTGGTDGNVMVCRFSTGEAIKTIVKAHDDTVLSLHFDDRYLVTGGRDKKIKLWTRHSLDTTGIDLPDFAIRPPESNGYPEYSLLTTFEGHDAPVNAVKLRDDLLVSGSGDGRMCIWSLQTGEMLQKVNIHQRGIACLQFNGRFVVSGSTDNSARIYDVDHQVEVACLKGHTNLIRSVQAVFDDCGEVTTIITGSYDGSIRVWQQSPDSREWRTQDEFHLDGFQVNDNVHPDNKADKFGERIFSIAINDDRFVCAGQGPMIRVWSPYKKRSSCL